MRRLTKHQIISLHESLIAETGGICGIARRNYIQRYLILPQEFMIMSS